MFLQALGFLTGHLCRDFDLVFALVSSPFDLDVTLLLVVQVGVPIHRGLDLPTEFTIDCKAILLVLHLLLQNASCVRLFVLFDKRCVVLALIRDILQQRAAVFVRRAKVVELRGALLLQALSDLVGASVIDSLG